MILIEIPFEKVLATPTIPKSKAPMAESTPAPKLSIDSSKSFPSTSFGTASFTPPTPAAQSTFIVSLFLLSVTASLKTS